MGLQSGPILRRFPGHTEMVGRWKWPIETDDTRPGKHTKNYGKSPFFMGKSTISMVIFNSYVKLPEGIPSYKPNLYFFGGFSTAKC